MAIGGGPLHLRRGAPRRRARRADLGPQRRASSDIAADESEGIGVRVRVGGAWGFAATARVSARRRRGRARARARDRRGAADGRRDAARAGRSSPRRGHWDGAMRAATRSPSRSRTSCAPASPPRRALRGDARIVRTRGRAARRSAPRSAFASTEGAACTQVATECGGGISAVAVDDDELQVRSYPSSATAAHVAPPAGSTCSALDLAAHAPRVAEEAVALLTAPACPARTRRRVVLDGEQLALQVHESIGHALELDRMLLRRGVLRRHELGRARRPRLAALRLRAAERHRRRDAARRPRARSAGTTRASPPGARR